MPANAVHPTKAAWTSEEDNRLDELVQHFGTKCWAHIARCLGNRTGKQCRERWRNHLDPTVRKGPFTREEDATILAMVEKVGTRWSAISHLLPGRTDNAVKNRYNSALKKRKAKEEDNKRRESRSPSPADQDEPVVSASPIPRPDGEHVAATPDKGAARRGAARAAIERPQRRRRRPRALLDGQACGSPQGACSEPGEGENEANKDDPPRPAQHQQHQQRGILVARAVLCQPAGACEGHPHVKAWHSLQELAQLERSAAVALCALRAAS